MWDELGAVAGIPGVPATGVAPGLLGKEWREALARGLLGREGREARRWKAEAGPRAVLRE